MAFSYERGTPVTSQPSFRSYFVCVGPLGSSSSQHGRTPKLVLQEEHASFRITFRPPGAEDRGRNYYEFKVKEGQVMKLDLALIT